MQSKIEIAFRRKVRAIWLEQGVALAAQGIAWHEAKPPLAESISKENPGVETIRKVLEHIRRMWFEPPVRCIDLHAAALKLANSGDSKATRAILIWGMAIAAYPFVGSVAEALGRLLKLQQEVDRSDIQRRLREQHGDRDFVNRITRYNISSFLDWEVISETKCRGVYQLSKPVRPLNGEQISWVAEAVLISSEKSQMPFAELANHPALFPIVLDNLNVATLQANPRLRVERQSLRQEFVFLDSH